MHQILLLTRTYLRNKQEGKPKGEIKATLADSSVIKGRIEEMELEMQNKCFHHNVIVTKLGASKFIVGRDLFSKFDFIQLLNARSFNEERNQLMDLITTNVETTKDLPALVEPLHITLKKNNICWTKQYRVIPEAHKKSIDQAVEEWRKSGIIQSSIITAPKKDIGVISPIARRVCIDLAKINGLIEEETNDIPLVEEIFETIADGVFFLW